MFTPFTRMSLRTRLALLAGFAIVAFTISLVVAWKLARTTEAFTLRQADSAVHAAARDLARELRANPNGYQTIEEATPGGHDHAPPRPAPPHVEKIFRTYTDPFDRLSAVTLHRYPNVEGGIYRTADQSLAGASQTNSTELVELIKQVANEASSSGEPASRSTQLGTTRVILVAYPAGPDSVWALQRLAYTGNVYDWSNLASLVALALSILAVSFLAIITVRDLRTGVAGIEHGLAELSTDLNGQVPAPKTRELARIARAINELAATLRANIARQSELEKQLLHSERLSALGRVVAGVAHEVRNPLSAIKLKVQLAQRSSYDADKLAETFNVIRAEVERLDSLVTRLLELGGQQQFEFHRLDLSLLIRNRADFFRDVAKKSGVAIHTESRAEPIFIDGDEHRLAQVADNIIQNAIDAMPSGGKLTIKTARRSSGELSWANVTFADTGHGIPPADREKIFEPFHTGRADGTGLGLSIARAIVEEHGGRLSVVSEVAQGTSFLLELPTTQRRES